MSSNKATYIFRVVHIPLPKTQGICGQCHKPTSKGFHVMRQMAPKPRNLLEMIFPRWISGGTSAFICSKKCEKAFLAEGKEVFN